MIHQCICFTISGKITRSGSCLAILTQTEAGNSITVSFHRKRLDEATAEDGDLGCPACFMELTSPQARAAHKSGFCYLGGQ